ncbi:MAG TPA: hypothetical protein VKU19_23295 [Bryobacteraceae bacterium]|nr:hypothetical protein [Bryobacteraceae bacterium]
MRWFSGVLLLIAIGCGRPANPPPSRPADSVPQPVRITQFYATEPKVAPGDKELLCYGVENAKTVSLSPPRQELSASPSRCVEVNPSATTTYTLTAEAPGSPPATKEVTVTLGAARVKIIEVKVSTLDLHLGDQLSFCYQVQNAKSVVIEPVHYRGGTKPQSCFMTSPTKTTTYTVTATGADGDTDQEHVTVKVR